MKKSTLLFLSLTAFLVSVSGAVYAGDCNAIFDHSGMCGRNCMSANPSCGLQGCMSLCEGSVAVTADRTATVAAVNTTNTAVVNADAEVVRANPAGVGRGLNPGGINRGAAVNGAGTFNRGAEVNGAGTFNRAGLNRGDAASRGDVNRAGANRGDVNRTAGVNRSDANRNGGANRAGTRR